MNCRHCQKALSQTFVDLGFAPPSNAYLTREELSKPETHYPLRVLVCDGCWLVQTEDYASAQELFTDNYAYFSSTSSSWLAHASRFSSEISSRLTLNELSFIVEVASNDGYLLRNFVTAGIPCLGIEPTASTAAVCESHGIPVLREFFSELLGERVARTYGQADLIVGNNVYAHVPDINDFTRGLKAVLKPGGTITLEFPHLLRLVESTQFDTIYHEHFSYLSLYTVGRIFESTGLRLLDVEELQTHGGSLRVYGCHHDDPRETALSVTQLLEREREQGLQNLSVLSDFQVRADRIKNDLLSFLIDVKRAGHSVAAYGAAAKGNTLLNYAGVRPDLLPFVCDAAKSKQGKFMPGSHIPIRPPEDLFIHNPDFVIILPWNIAAEVKDGLASLKARGSRLVTAIPSLQVG